MATVALTGWSDDMLAFVARQGAAGADAKFEHRSRQRPLASSFALSGRWRHRLRFQLSAWIQRFSIPHRTPLPAPNSQTVSWRATRSNSKGGTPVSHPTPQSCAGCWRVGLGGLGKSFLARVDRANIATTVGHLSPVPCPSDSHHHTRERDACWLRELCTNTLYGGLMSPTTRCHVFRGRDDPMRASPFVQHGGAAQSAQ